MFLFSLCVLFIDLVHMSIWFCRNLEDDMCEMVCTLTIDFEVLKAPLGYKYVIYSPKVTKCDECYEKLHSLVNWRSDDPNRCLWMTPQERHHAYGGIHVKIPSQNSPSSHFISMCAFKDSCVIKAELSVTCLHVVYALLVWPSHYLGFNINPTLLCHKRSIGSVVRVSD